MNLILAITLLIVSVIAGAGLVSFLNRVKSEHVIKLMLAFSGGFLLSIAFIHFIPELYEDVESNIGLFILIGFLIQLILEFFSGGIEHGHIHVHNHAAIPVALIVALCMHSFIEGIPLGNIIAGKEIAIMNHHHSNDNSLLLGILFHRVPVAIALMTFLIASKISVAKTWLVIGIFAVTAPVGVLFGVYSINWFVDFDFNIILAVVVGMFLHISTTIIFETSENHKFNFVKLLSIITGCALAFLMH